MGSLTSQPNLDCGNLEYSEVVRGVFFVAGNDTSGVFDTIGKPFDPAARLVKRLAHDGSTFSGVGASGKLGVVHSLPVGDSESDFPPHMNPSLRVHDLGGARMAD